MDVDRKGEGENMGEDMPSEGYTLLLGLTRDKGSKGSIVVRRRGEGGFEKRGLWRCLRCALVVGYEILGSGDGVDNGGKGEKGEEWEGKVLYILRGGIMSTEVMREGRKITEAEVDITGGTGVWE